MLKLKKQRHKENIFYLLKTIGKIDYSLKNLVFTYNTTRCHKTEECILNTGRNLWVTLSIYEPKSNFSNKV
jgi:hypothetical protein